jgi:DNA-binding ferritin-like protein (Dps family)
MDVESTTTVPATDAAAPAAKAPGGIFQDYVAKIQAAIQKYIENGGSVEDLGHKIFGSILNAFEPSKHYSNSSAL